MTLQRSPFCILFLEMLFLYLGSFKQAWDFQSSPEEASVCVRGRAEHILEDRVLGRV